MLLLITWMLVGACIGSFVNLVVIRLPANESCIMLPRSYCRHCKHTLRWFENLPIVAFIGLRGKCSQCRAAIPWRYVIIEILTAGLYGALWVRLHEQPLALALWSVLTIGLLIVAFLDIDHWWIPDVVTYPMLLLAVCAIPFGGSLGEATRWSLLLLGILPAVLMFAVGWLFSRVSKQESLGFGDVKLLAAVGLALGFQHALMMLILAAVQATVMGLLVIAAGGHHQRAYVAPPALVDDDDNWQPPAHAIPFGPFIVLATFEVVLLPQLWANLFQRLMAGLVHQMLAWF